MKGLILKDFYMIWKYQKSFFFLMIVFLGYSVFDNGNPFFTLYPVVLAAMIPMTLLSYDEKFGWHKYCDAMPITRAQFVSGKYIITLISVLALILVSGIIQLGSRLILGGDIAEVGAISFSMLCIGLGIPVLLLPPVFKLGTEKGRMFYYIIIGLVCAVAAIGMTLSGVENNIEMNISTIAIGIGVVVLFALSWLLSIKLYNKRSL